MALVGLAVTLAVVAVRGGGVRAVVARWMGAIGGVAMGGWRFTRYEAWPYAKPARRDDTHVLFAGPAHPPSGTHRAPPPGAPGVIPLNAVWVSDGTPTEARLLVRAILAACSRVQARSTRPTSATSRS